ncbi:MAG: NAD(P)-dependent alcohol dehydrogenase [Candidatus Omnitrophica bacterium]|nr:NAD(P)-dependent alcohol dehydrogenase [Candidatus Omnitrophota bacterium]
MKSSKLCYAYAAHGPKSNLRPFRFRRRAVGPNDVLIEILYCGICHSDIHTARNEWQNTAYPVVPGHEIVGRVRETGARVMRFRPGQIVGVGCFVDSCRKCDHCRAGLEQYCDAGVSWTYNGTLQDRKTGTFGGYSDHIVVDQNYVLRISHKSNLAAVAPLLCAGITTYGPLRHYGVKRADKVAVAGLGGLGHMGVKIAASLGAEVTVISTSAEKERDARRMGAKKFLLSSRPENFGKFENYFHFILDTVSAPHDLDRLLGLLRRDGTLCVVGAPGVPQKIDQFNLIMKRRKFGGSLIGGIRETQEMLDYTARRGIVSDIELIPIQKVNEAYARTVRGDVKYRFVIDLQSLGPAKA